MSQTVTQSKRIGLKSLHAFSCIEWVGVWDKTRSIPPNVKWNYGCMDKNDDAIVFAKYCRVDTNEYKQE